MWYALSLQWNEKKFEKVWKDKNWRKTWILQNQDEKFKNPEKKEIQVTGEHIMIIFDENKEFKLVNAQDLKWNEYFGIEDGLYQVYEINKEINDNKYNLIVNGSVVYANGILVSTVCTKDQAKFIKPKMEKWKQFQGKKIELN